MNPITLPLAELKPALAGLSKIISKRVTLPVLGCVRIERTREGRIELAGTDLDRTAVVRLDTPDQGEPTTLLIPLEDLANVAKSCGRNDALVIASLGTEEAAIRFPVAGQIVEHKCRSLPFPEFPTIEEVPGNPTVLDAAVRQSIHEALQCSSTDPTRLILNGVCLDVSKPGAHYVVGTDGSHLFSANSFALPLRESLVVPSHPFLGWKGFNEDGDWRLRVRADAKDSPRIFELASEHWRYLCRSLEGNYPNWRQVVPTSAGAACNIEIPADALEDVIQIILRLPNHDERNHTIGIQTQGRSLRLLAKSQADQEWTSVEVQGPKCFGKDVKTFVNRQLLLKALRFGLTRIDLIDERSAVRLSAGGRQMIVMPIRADYASASRPVTPSPAPVPAAANPPPQPAEQPKEENTMPATNGTNGGAKPSPAAKPEEPKAALDTALAQVEIVRGDFRNAIAGLTKLGDLLRQAQRESKVSEKEVSSVRATLRSLQSVRI